MSNGKVIGISISEPDPGELGKLGFGLVHLQDAMVEIARYLLTKGYNLAYGGDLNHEKSFNFTELLFQLGMTYGGMENRIVNYSAFPIYTKISKKHEAELIRAGRIIKVNPSPEFDHWLDVKYEFAEKTQKEFLDEVFKGETEKAKKIWADSLARMRETMSESVSGHIAIGGKINGYKGNYPGIMEEVVTTINLRKQVFIDDAFGGCSKMIGDLISGKNTHSPVWLTSDLSEILINKSDYIFHSSSTGLQDIQFGLKEWLVNKMN
jgi:hypothetical protein